MSATDTVARPKPPRQPRQLRAADRLGPASGLGLGVLLLWFSVLVLLPLSAVVVTATEGGWSTFVDVVSQRDTRAALLLTVGEALLVALVNAVVGTVIAWVLVRDDFRGKRLLEIVIDIPFALPTIVAGLVLVSLYGPRSPIGVDVVGTRTGIFLALLFVTLPFVVRTVQPVLEELDGEVEEAAASLGASQATILRRIILPSLVPAITAGTSLAFARAISEFGSLVLIAGNRAGETEVASVRILKFIERDQFESAAVVAFILLLVSALVIVALDLLSRKVAVRG
ncbi:sulfate ABC transporter permease subunit CysT [Nocardioides zeae]|uniref:Sulfate transport system permease protein CysT n=1 Tax=Nocardioides imazamoxiresistens TaxID=3231893 RepID=A0ABU3Q021_9ACTN|nr:sulfate ABC transporter permease subunit CysT [Nocardioides zeae]MDT9594857.1 sulfate ABC transporter permease subunit CysT [Nocardioides zeae]